MAKNALTILAPILLLTLCALTAPPAQAGNRAMLELLKVLLDNGTISQEAYEILYKTTLEEDDEALLTEQASPLPKSPKDPQKHPPQEQALTKQRTTAANTRLGRNGLEIESADGDFRFELGGRILVDAAWYDQDLSDLENNTEIRSSRLSLRGILWDDWQFKSEIEFAQDGADLKSNYLRYRGFKPVLITVGNFREPFGLERSVPITKTTFMERAAVSMALAPARSIGLGVRTSERKWSLNAGLFSNRDLGGNQSGDNNEYREESWALTGRATFTPVLAPSRLLHTGIATSYRTFDDGRIRYRARPESHLTDTRFVDTGAITDVDDVLRYGLEASAVLGPFSLQTEYIATETSRNGAGPKLHFDGWYAYASYLLTGESRPYRHNRGVYRGIEPLHPLDRNGSGAWEVGLRYSHLDLTDQDVTGGIQDLLTFGLNWYPNANIRFMANYINVLNVDRPGSVFDGDEPHFIQIRGQVDF